jgi:hypothetical protein
MSEIVVDEVVTYWRMIVTTLRKRGLLRERFPSGDVVVPEADAYVLSDRVVFVLHLQHLGGIPIDVWLERGLWERWRTALAGRRVFVTRDDGLALTVSRDPMVGRLDVASTSEQNEQGQT